MRRKREILSYTNTTFPLGNKTFCLHFIKSTSQRETLTGKRDNNPPYETEQNVFLSTGVTWQNVFSLTGINFFACI